MSETQVENTKNFKIFENKNVEEILCHEQIVQFVK